ncbi:unnamed protein product (macronuclear) [Paramecium tetraurelia]|uniref:YTH domain-containing protein n=1 Tax=Paramecium tetraurelia TaxID=5888 RepID=A0BTR1_PARTE|nr:uncharacterized protein GSPATT00032160001 [Paramecium tetraurelia]CAK61928.1 unnamed protein product [Paramecium tetraurelia]|eukprot:XP_001429326.1 hypothetical protein (macronuclear) [Paramecium tetraurelia strain d4-2]
MMINQIYFRNYLNLLFLFKQMMNDQPPFISLESYDDINQIRKKFPSLAKINLNHEFNNLEECKFFIIRTQGEDNVHRAMKYGIWTSSSRKNERLHEAFTNKKQEVYLFFTEINSMCFSGMAKLTSAFNPKFHFKFWLIENKWFGTFSIEWLYIKDLSFKLFENIKQIQKLEGSEETLKSVYDLIDCTELSNENGIKMTKIFQNEVSNKSLFEEFPQLDKLEFENREERTNNQRFEKKFKELSSVFETIPFSFSVASYERKKNNRKSQGGYYQPPYGQQYYYQQPYQPYYYQQQQVGYQFQQTPQYWQQNNGFYQNQYYQQQNSNKQQYGKQQNYEKPARQNQQQQYSQNQGFEQQQNPESNGEVQNFSLDQRFQINNQQLQKRTKIEKTKKYPNKNEVEYVEKSQAQTSVQKN